MVLNVRKLAREKGLSTHAAALSIAKQQVMGSRTLVNRCILYKDVEDDDLPSTHGNCKLTRLQEQVLVGLIHSFYQQNLPLGTPELVSILMNEGCTSEGAAKKWVQRFVKRYSAVLKWRRAQPLAGKRSKRVISTDVKA